jgi:hypothetical protein
MRQVQQLPLARGGVAAALCCWKGGAREGHQQDLQVQRATCSSGVEAVCASG